MKKFLALILTFVFAVGTLAGAIQPPKGFTKKLYDASYALYAISASRGFTEPKFLCTVTPYQRYTDGYLFLGAGHCTSANPELPEDMTFFIENDIHGSPQPVELIKAALSNETFTASQVAVQPLDYAIFYLKTKAKLPVIALGDESSLRVGSKTINVNFSLGLAKYVAPGVVSSLVAHFGAASGFFGVQMFMSHGASGSSVVDVKTKKIIGLVIAGEDGATVPAWIEPISVITAQLKTLSIPQLIAHPDIPQVDRVVPEDYFAVSLLSSHLGNRSESRGNSRGNNRSDRVLPPISRIAPPPNRIERPEHHERPDEPHQRGRSVDQNTQRRYFGRDHCFRPEIYYTGGFYSFVYAGIWFDYEYEWPYPIDDVFIDIGPDGLYYMSSPAHPGVIVQVWVP